MNPHDAIEALRPFTSKVPQEALDFIRSNWADAERVLLEAIDDKLARPKEEDRSALFLYALYLCAEMKAPAAFERYVAICRLPNLVLDHVLGDILTEDLPQMLARTCHGRIDDLKALAEDRNANAFARGGALGALRDLVLDGDYDREALMAYCVMLLGQRLETVPSHIWDATIAVATDLHPKEAMPFIEKALACGLADPGFADLEYAQAALRMSQKEAIERTRRLRRKLTGTEERMQFFVSQWSKDEAPAEPDDPRQLLDVLIGSRGYGTHIWGAPKIGRNDPCPCGSGKKYKRCCIDNPVRERIESVSVLNHPVTPEHAPANDWMEAGYLHADQHRTRESILCWQRFWEELQDLLPATLRTPADAEESGAFAGCEFLVNWMHDFTAVLEDRAKHDLRLAEYGLGFCDAVLRRFPSMDELTKSNMQVSRARFLALVGRGDEALSALSRMVEAHPETAQGYVALSELISWDAGDANVEPDVQRARSLLRTALERAADCDDYDVQVRLDDLDRLACD